MLTVAYREEDPTVWGDPIRARLRTEKEIEVPAH